MGGLLCSPNGAFWLAIILPGDKDSHQPQKGAIIQESLATDGSGEKLRPYRKPVCLFLLLFALLFILPVLFLCFIVSCFLFLVLGILLFFSFIIILSFSLSFLCGLYPGFYLSACLLIYQSIPRIVCARVCVCVFVFLFMCLRICKRTICIAFSSVETRIKQN